ncbi:LOW QUALITY PROTEIN: protein disulfide-isomerase-like protein of the testis [Pterocles gutturalis]
MKTHQFFLLPLLFLTSFAAADSISSNETKPKKPKLPEVKKENKLKKSNFGRALKETKYLLVEFCEYRLPLSSTLMALQSTTDAVLRFMFIPHGEETRVRQTSAFITWVKRTGPSTVFINSTDQAEATVHADDLSVIGFFKEPHNDSVEVFCGMARDVPEMAFGLTASDNVCANYGIQKNTLGVFKRGKPVHNEVLENGRQRKLDLMRLIKAFTLDLITEYNLETPVKIFDVPVEQHILLFTPRRLETFNVIYGNYKSAAAEFRGKMFVLVDTSETRYGQFEYFPVREVHVPAMRILNLTSDTKYKMPADEVTVENLKEFCQSYLNGKAKLHLSSEEIPEDWDKMPVKVLVGKNFNKIVFNKTMTEVAYASEHILEAFYYFLEKQSKTKAEPGEKDPAGGIKEDLSQKRDCSSSSLLCPSNIT